MDNVTSFEDILSCVRKPGRYLGNEWNVVKKDFLKQDVKFAICFPDLYEVGMSNLGLRIIYGLLNSQEGVCCERVFLPDIDMQEILKERKLPLFSLESKSALTEFDFIGFCLHYELDYTNILKVLDLAGIPLLARDRDSNFPLIIAGGVCSCNPEPLADFIDLFLIGEAEEALLEIIDSYKNLQVTHKRSQLKKEDALREIAKVEGVYVPSFYNVTYNKEGEIKEFSPKYPDIPVKITKRIVKNLDKAYYPVDWLVPYVEIVHDRAPIELMRGCPHRCNFCQARNVYHNLRIRSPDKVLELTRKIYQSSGYEEISFLSLSTSDYPCLNEVIESLDCEFKEQAVGISLPSLRPKAYLGALVNYLRGVRKTTLTFAPEVGSQKLLKTVNKDLNMDELYSAVFAAYKAGWQAVKLYFMIGLPDEDAEDLEGILKIAKKVSDLRKEITGHSGRVHLSISSFVPKPHTFFEREPMVSYEILKNKLAYLRERSKSLPKCIKIDFHNLRKSLLEGAFSRGDRTLGSVLLAAYKKGCLLDGWQEHFKPDLWACAFNDCGKPMEYYLRPKEAEDILPWDHIDLLSDITKLDE